MAPSTDLEPTGRSAAALEDLAAETAEASAVLDGLSAEDWLRPTAAGWSVRDHVVHLARFDEVARLALADPDTFLRIRDEDRQRGEDCAESLMRDLLHLRPLEAHRWFVRARRRLEDEFRSAEPASRLPWYGGPADPVTILGARLVETWAHLQDVVDALGGERRPGRRLRRIADLTMRDLVGRSGPHGPAVRVRLASPGDGTWLWGPPGAPNVVSGSAAEFCLVATGRRSLSDTDLRVTGKVAVRWAAEAADAVQAPRCPLRSTRRTEGARA